MGRDELHISIFRVRGHGLRVRKGRFKMQRTNRNNAVCFEGLEQALFQCAETYGCIDLLCAGWPCQDNSIAGNRKGHAGQKSGLWGEVRRLIGIFYPKWLVLENVPGLFSVNNGKNFWNVISDLDSLGYCVAWDVLDSQNFGVAQRRKRVFIIGSFGNVGATKVLFEPESGGRNDKKKQEVGQRGLCLLAKEAERRDPTNCTFIASTIRGQDCPQTGNKGAVKHNFIAQTVNAGKRGNAGRIWEDTHIAETNSDRKRETPRVSSKLDSVRGVVIGNAVTVNVAKWIGERIAKYEKPELKS